MRTDRRFRRVSSPAVRCIWQEQASGTLTLADDDDVHLSNSKRKFCSTPTISPTRKAQAAKLRLPAQPGSELIVLQQRLIPRCLKRGSSARSRRVVLDRTDNYYHAPEINAACVALNTC